MVQIGSNWFKLDQIGSKWFKLIQIGKLVHFGSNWFKLVQIGSNWFKLVQIGSNWFCNDITLESQLQGPEVGCFQKTLQKDSLNKFLLLAFTERRSPKKTNVLSCLPLRGLTGLSVVSAVNVGCKNKSVFVHFPTLAEAILYLFWKFCQNYGRNGYH